MHTMNEPNIVAEQPITVQLMNRRRNYLEEYARFGWSAGLLAAPDNRNSLELRVDNQDVISLVRIHAIGENGHPLVVGDGESDINFDAAGLGVGRYHLYLCLAHERKPHGPVVEFLPPSGDRPRRYQEDLRARFSLELNQARLQHRDWIKVAVLDRIRENGVVRTLVDSQYHPPINDLRAYTRSNPLPALVDALLQEEAVKEEGALPALVRAHLRGLLAIAGQGSPEAVFLQTQNCLELVRELVGPSSILNAGLLGVQYSPESFCRFLHDIQQALTGIKRQPFPEVLEVEENRYLRADGEFLPEGDFWVWSPSRSPFLASGVALYLPNTTTGVPWVGHGHHREESADWPLASIVKDLSHPGVAITFPVDNRPFEKIYLRTNSTKESQNLRLQLGEGHAVYYF
jgi:hypothetical protein